MSVRTMQKFLLAVGVLAVIFLLLEIGISLSATLHGSKPARVDQVTAGPYRFAVSVYDDPARAGFVLPFAIAPQGTTSGSWTYHVTSVPQGNLQPNGQIVMTGPGRRIATPIKDSVSPDPHVLGGVQGTAEITVQGQWNLHVVVDGPQGQQTFNVVVTATTLPAIPNWFGWVFGFLPLYGIIAYLLLLVVRSRRHVQGAVQVG